MSVDEANRCVTCGQKQRTGTRHAKLAEDIRERIRRGYLKPGDSLPSEAVLMERWSYSRITVRTALSTLERQGWVAVARGKGRTVIGVPKTDRE